MSAVQKKTQASSPELEPTVHHSEESYLQKRLRILSEKEIDYDTTRKAWFTLSHLLLDAGSKIVDTGCGDGKLTFTMAALNPEMEFVGLDKSKRMINQAKARYELPNLTFKVGDASSGVFEPESIDAVINSYFLHVMYSNSRYNEEIITKTLETQFKMLKTGGTMFIRDFAHPPPDQYILMELLDEKSTGNDLAGLSEADLLVWYSEHARPRQDPGCGGFFLEELPPRRPGKRLFRLPYKWAYEFMLRKDDRSQWETELPVEYMFFTPREYRQTLGKLGARVQYSGPHWDEDYINKHLEGRVRLFSKSGHPLGNPPTSFIAVATKMVERKSLKIEERRPSSQAQETSLSISAVRNQKTGEMTDIVKRNQQISEIIPYRIHDDGRLKIYLHDGVARSITNSVARNGINIDGRQWSGHMVETIAVREEELLENPTFDHARSVRFARDILGMKPENNAVVEMGPDYYPSPDYIDERIFTFFLAVRPKNKPFYPKPATDHSGRFLAKGKIRELDAQHVLNAITVGMVPNARLELQILALFEHLGIKAENWSSKHFNIQKGKITSNLKARDLLTQLENNIKRFQDIRGTTGQIRPVHSIFVEEGLTKGTTTGLSAQDVDFIVHNDKTVNTAVVLPIIKGMKNDIHAGFQVQHMPVPQRYEGKSTVVSAPSFNLPPDIVNTKMAKAFIAEKFGVLPDMVIKLGESYYSHLGVSPQRIYPFAVAAPPDHFKDMESGFLPFFQLMIMQDKLKKDMHFMTVMARCFRMFHDDIRFDLEARASAIVKERFSDVKPAWSLPMRYDTVPAEKQAFASAESNRPPSLETAGSPKPQTESLVQSSSPRAPTPPAPSHRSFHEKNQDSQVAEPNTDTDTTMDEELEAIVDALEQTNEKTTKPQPENW